MTLSYCLTVGLAGSVCACEDSKPAPGTATPSAAPAALAPPAATTAPAPTPESATPAPKPARKLEDCPKGPNFDFQNEALEAEVRRKLPKAEGPVTLADLRRVRSLNLSQIKLDELDVCFFSQLKGVKELFLGAGDYADLSPIAGSTQLESLRASINQVKDLTPLAKLTKMDRLDLGRTQVKDLSPLAAMTKLTELQLDGTPVEDVAPLAKLKELETLSLKRTQVKDVSALKDLKKLKFLYTGGSPLDEDPMSVAPVRANGTKIIAD
jgi:internalin A